MPRHRGYKPHPHLAHLKALSSHRHLGQRRELAALAPPPSWDSRTVVAIGPVKDQGNCGSCWAFSGVGLVEIAWAARQPQPGTPYNLSEQYIIACRQSGGCNGDDNVTVLGYAKGDGIPSTAEYGGYDPLQRSCNYKPSMALYALADWGFVDPAFMNSPPAINLIKAAIQKYKAVGCAVAADDAFEQWGDQHHDFATPFPGSGSKDLDHDVILVGWHDDRALPAGGYWIVRNSWSKSWGMNGHAAMCYGANLIGAEAVWALAKSAAPPPPAPSGKLRVTLSGTVQAGQFTLSGSATPVS